LVSTSGRFPLNRDEVGNQRDLRIRGEVPACVRNLKAKELWEIFDGGQWPRFYCRKGIISQEQGFDGRGPLLPRQSAKVRLKPSRVAAVTPMQERPVQTETKLPWSDFASAGELEEKLHDIVT